MKTKKDSYREISYYIILTCFFLFASFKLFSLNISDEELSKIGKLIYKNETGAKRDNLIVWNNGEEFLSLGIGHFIWYPEDYEGPFEESFPKLRDKFIEEGYELPYLFRYSKAPFTFRDEFLCIKGFENRFIYDAIRFLEITKHIQLKYIYERLEKSLDLILEETKYKEKVEKNFYRVLNEKFGLYPLVDYVNFKGEGINHNERYNGEGWGLMQVLELMDEACENPIEEFATRAKEVLQRRVDNSPLERGEERWTKGWNNRIDTYVKESEKY